MYHKKSKIVIGMCVVVLLMVVGYAVFNTQLKINGTATIGSTWEILFTKIEKISTKGSASERITPTAVGTTATFHVDFVKPGDSMEYEITLENRGSLDAIVSEIVANENGSNAIKFDIENIKTGDKLPKKSSTTFNVTVSFDESVTDNPDLADNTLTIEVKCAQDTGQDVTPGIPIINSDKLVSKILKNNKAQSDENIDFTKASSDTNGKGLYYTNKNTDDGKTTYYFRGEVNNNYVRFANRLWRIVRINEDGSTRIVTEDIVGNSVYNEMYTDNGYVGYMHGDNSVSKELVKNSSDSYGIIRHSSSTTIKVSTNYSFNSSTGYYTLATPVNGQYTSSYHNYYTCNGESRCQELYKIKNTSTEDDYNLVTEAEIRTSYFSESYEQAHANKVDSSIKKYIDTWYQTNLSSYRKYLADSGFCNDRSIAETAGSNNLGYGINRTYYGGIDRILYGNTYPPKFLCSQANDLFTLKDSKKGNKSLAYPIGLLTADEVLFAGGARSKTFYLFKDTEYFLMTPYGSLLDDFPSISIFNPRLGNLTFDRPSSSLGVRPVINLGAFVEVSSGDGTSSNPYVIKTN